MTELLLQVNNLKKHFPIKGGVFGKTVGEVKAVDGISFFVNKGETLGLVGESGCGKSTTGRMLLRLTEPTAGEIVFGNKDVTNLNKGDLRKIRREMQMVFQDPYASLNPRHTVEKILEEPLIVHGIGSSSERKKKIKKMLDVVGLSSYHAKRYPHQFSGGQRQRIGIARALMTNPKLLIADEPVSALDVSIQAQVLNLFQDLQQEFELTYIFISHDLGVVRHISDRVGVMYLGRLVELADSEKLYKNPIHPYTKALLSAVPVPDPDYRRETPIMNGDIHDSIDQFHDCAFHGNCEHCQDSSQTSRPELQEIEPGHFVACHAIK